MSAVLLMGLSSVHGQRTVRSPDAIRDRSCLLPGLHPGYLLSYCNAPSLATGKAGRRRWAPHSSITPERRSSEADQHLAQCIAFTQHEDRAQAPRPRHPRAGFDAQHQ